MPLAQSYPVFYTPGPAAKRPACCRYLAPVHVGRGQGPDRVVDADGNPTDAGGYYWGNGTLNPDRDWQQSSAGWWVAWGNHLPQDLQRIDLHPRILRWRSVPGAEPSHLWTVPVLLGQDDHGTFRPALDRVYGPQGWQEPDDLADLVGALLRIAAGDRLASEDPAENDAALLALFEQLVALGHHADLALLGTRPGWITDRVVTRFIRAALGLAALDPEGLT